MRAWGWAWIVLAACGSTEDDDPAPEPGVWTEREMAALKRLRLDVTPRPSPTNRWADDPKAAELGQALFHDPGLSGNGQISCATCHQPELHFTDGLELSVGLEQTDRHTPSIIGNQWGAWFFWDGRADSLWAQALGPIEDPKEMGGDRTQVAHHVAEAYREPYEQVFGALPDMSEQDQHAATQVYVNVGKALAAYQRLLVPQEAPLDHYIDALKAGDQTGGGHLDQAQVRGLSLFLRQGQCVSCHTGPMLTDRAFHNLGLEESGFSPGRTRGAREVLDSPFNCKGPWSDADDCPELRHLDPEFQDFMGAFKTPSLRYVAETAPYMHDGSLPDLESVLEFYSELPGDPRFNHRALMLERLDLTDEQIADLIAFLGALTGPPIPDELAGPPDAP